LINLYPEVRRQLEEIGCQQLATIRPGVEGWNSPRTGDFLVDNPIRSRANANNILKNAGIAPLFQ
jgi:hypothetical protein